MRERFTRKEFLDALFGDYFRRRDGFLIVRSTKQLDRRISTRFFPSVEILAKEPYQQDQEVYVGVCPRQTMKAERPDIRFVTALWAGVDLTPDGYSGKETYFDSSATAAKAVRSFPLPPSIIVESGHGMHLYWLLREVMEIHDPSWVERQLRRINRYFQCQAEVKIDAMLRLPVTYNNNMPMQPVLCEVKYLNTDFRYTPKDFEAAKLVGEADKPSGAQAGGTVPAVASAFVGEFQGPSEQLPDRSDEFRQSVGQGPGKSKRVTSGSPASNANWQPEPRHASVSAAFEPLPYEPTEENARSVPRAGLSSVSLDALADRVADRVLDKLTDRLSDSLVERIVSELTKRILPG